MQMDALSIAIVKQPILGAHQQGFVAANLVSRFKAINVLWKTNVSILKLLSSRHVAKNPH